MDPHRLLARTLIYDGTAHPLTLITSLGNGEFLIEPFTAETPSTTFENAPLALIPDDAEMPSGNSLHEIILALRNPLYLTPNKKLKLISITPSGCTDYSL